ncbi:MAG: SGNH/GDSL hydrolase family protein [Actinobacteria bacterium]|nr:SGNH/GDSL hydrolase family protein [Actinomycetota bacterium]
MGFRTLRRLGLVACALVGLVLPASTTGGAQTGSYTGLGDSYAAGPVVPTQQPTPIGCLKSDHNYVHLVATALATPFRDATCSGAKTDHMTTPQNVDGGPNPPQFDSLDASTTLVTVTIGGNDIGFTEIARSCFTGDPNSHPCQDRYVVGGVDEISNRIAAAAPKVATVLQGIHTRAPDARVFLVSYLSILPEVGNGCWPQLPFAYADVPYLRAKEQELNNMLATQAAANGAAVVDAHVGSIGHDACTAPGVRWVEPVPATALAAPLHPNALGMECVAQLVLAQVDPGNAFAQGLCRPPVAQPVMSVPRFTG